MFKLPYCCAILNLCCVCLEVTRCSRIVGWGMMLKEYLFFVQKFCFPFMRLAIVSWNSVAQQSNLFSKRTFRGLDCLQGWLLVHHYFQIRLFFPCSFFVGNESREEKLGAKKIIWQVKTRRREVESWWKQKTFFRKEQRDLWRVFGCENVKRIKIKMVPRACRESKMPSFVLFTAGKEQKNLTKKWGCVLVPSTHATESSM